MKRNEMAGKRLLSQGEYEHKNNNDSTKRSSPGRYQNLDLFIEVLWALCP